MPCLKTIWDHEIPSNFALIADPINNCTAENGKKRTLLEKFIRAIPLVTKSEILMCTGLARPPHPELPIPALHQSSLAGLREAPSLCTQADATRHPCSGANDNVASKLRQGKNCAVLKILLQITIPIFI